MRVRRALASRCSSDLPALATRGQGDQRLRGTRQASRPEPSVTRACVRKQPAVHPFTTSTLIGTTTLAQLHENISSLDVKLSD
ncbi:MAG: hypothetical protein CBCREVIR_1392 [Candidatus Burkholderia crenata]|nr:MAG: hypothetical protein CBCREVIR_1392 [Candidatus Burkholderia crenata]